MEPCTRLGLGTKACAEEIAASSRSRRGARPQVVRCAALWFEGDYAEGEVEGRKNILHRDGSVLSAVTPDIFASEDPFYRQRSREARGRHALRDIATSAIFLREIPATAKAPLDPPPAGDRPPRGRAPPPSARPPTTPVGTPRSRRSPRRSTKAGAAIQDGRARSARQAVVFDGLETAEEVKAALELDPVMAAHRVRAGDEPPARLAPRLHRDEQLLGATVPVIHHMVFAARARVGDDIVIQSGAQAGGVLWRSGLGATRVMIEPRPAAPSLRLPPQDLLRLLQGSRMRNTKTEYVSCPSCGRTLFDLQEVTAAISERTGHLPGVAIAVMGCIVNGPGEMADADFGYVGGAPGKIDLYVGKEVVKRGIDNDTACDELIQLIKDHGRWVEKEEEEEEAAAARDGCDTPEAFFFREKPARGGWFPRAAAGVTS